MHALVIGLKARVVLAHYHIRSSSFCYVGWPAVALWLAGIFDGQGCLQAGRISVFNGNNKALDDDDDEDRGEELLLLIDDTNGIYPPWGAANTTRRAFYSLLSPHYFSVLDGH